MMTLELTEQQRDALIQVLERAINEQHTEIQHTDDRRWRERLRGEQDILSRLLQQLKIERDGGLGRLTPGDLEKSLNR